MPFALYEYDAAFHRFFGESLRALAVSRSPLLSEMPSFETSGTVASRVRDRDGMDVMLETGKTSTEIESDYGSIQRGDFVQLYVQLDKGSDSMAEQMVAMIVEGLGKVTEGTGNVVNAGGRPFSFELFYEVLNTLEFSLDENDELVMPSLLLHPDQMKKLQALPPQTPEQDQALEELKARKRAEALARRRRRRLS